MVSMQNLGVYASVLILVPMLAALLSMQALQGFDARYTAGLVFGIAIYLILVLLGTLVLFRNVKESHFAKGVMAGILYGFINAALASVAKGIPIIYEVLSIPSELAGPAGLDVSNPMLYMLSFVAFWVLILATAGRIMAAHRRG